MPIFSSDFKISDEKPLDEISDITYQFTPESARGTHGTNSEPFGIQSVDGKTLGTSLSDKPSMTKFNSQYFPGPINVLHPDVFPKPSSSYSLLVWFRTHTLLNDRFRMIVKHGDHNDFAEALSGHYISHTNTSLDFTAGPQVATSVTGLDFTDTSAWHCIVVSLDSSGITYLVDESKSGTGMLSESQATNVSAADVEFGSSETDIGMVIRMPNALTLDQMYTLKRSTQEPFLGSRYSVCPFSFSSGNLVINYSASASASTAYANLPWTYSNAN